MNLLVNFHLNWLDDELVELIDKDISLSVIHNSNLVTMTG